MKAILERIPEGGNYYITIDADGMDPAVMPAVLGPAPGGVTFHQARQLIHGHTPISSMSPFSPEDVTAPLVYANGLCVNVDAGMYLDGPGFVYQIT